MYAGNSGAQKTEEDVQFYWFLNHWPIQRLLLPSVWVSSNTRTGGLSKERDMRTLQIYRERRKITLLVKPDISGIIMRDTPVLTDTF